MNLSGLLHLGLDRAFHVPGLDLGLSATDLLGEELDTLVRTPAVGEVGSKKGEGATADEVADVADDEDLVAGEVGDLAIILSAC